MRTLPISQEYKKLNYSFKSKNEEPVSNEVKPVEKAKTQKNEKALPLVSAAVAVVSLGVAGYALSRGKKGGSNSAVTEGAQDIGRKVEDAINNKLGNLDSKINKSVEEAVNPLKEEVSNLKGKVDGINIDSKVNDLNQKVDSFKGEIVRKIGEVGGKSKDFPVQDVEVNGRHYLLANTLHGYGPKDAELVRTLQTESAKRVLGLAPLVAIPAAGITARFLTSEYQGFIKTGGMAAVPEEIIGNMGAYLNDKQSVDLVADIPLYLGAVENDKVARLERKDNGNYDYVTLTDGGRKRSVLAELEEIGSFPVEMYDDVNKTTEQVRMFRTARELESKVDFESTLAQLKPEVAERVKEALAEKREYRVGPLLFKPQIDINRVNIKVGEKQNINVGFEDFLTLFTDEAQTVIRTFMESGKAVSLKDVEEMLDTNHSREAISEMYSKGINPNEFKNKLDSFKKPVKIFRDDINKDSFTEIITNKEDANLLSDYMAKTNSSIPDFRILPKSNASVVTKYRAVFYDNKRFDMAGPFDSERDKDIYSNKVTTSGETERFMAFCKFFYEHLMPDNQAHLNTPLNADIIIGNDWQSGGVAALLRYLTPARKAFGLEAKFADKLQNTPFVTLMHNFKLRGEAYHSQERILNMLFGEHAAKIVQNAYAPSGLELPMHLWNTMFSNDGINPQTMAMYLSDYVSFVSVGNFLEASREPARGGVNYELAALRGRQGKYQDEKFLKKAAILNDFDENVNLSNPTASGITNGCDRINNIISREKARAVEMYLGLPIGSLISAEDVQILNAEGKNGAYIAHQNNKRVNLQKMLDDVKLAKDTNGAINPMKLHDIENTDLTGVNEHTMIIGMAGRIVDQKGVDIEAEGILEYYKSGNFDPENPPVIYIQGKGDKKFLECFWNVKREVAQINKKAADRMMFCNLFSEPGRYDACKMFSDFLAMPSWDEPCGLVHKEVAYASGAIPIVNKVGGLRDGLYEYGNQGENAIFVDFMDKDNNPIEKALPYNGKGFAKGIATAQEWYRNKERFELGIQNSYNGHYDWLGGKIQQYVDILKSRGIVNKDI